MECKNLLPLMAILLILPALLIAGCLGSGKTQAEPTYTPPALEEKLYPVVVQEEPAAPNVTKLVPFELTFINVGYGDASLIQSEGKNILIDTGPDADASKIKSVLASKGVKKIDLLVLSEDDILFVNGAADILRSYPVDEVWVSGGRPKAGFMPVILPLAKNSIVKTVLYGDNYTLGNLSLTVLNPFPGENNTSPDLDSIVLKAKYADFCSLIFSNSEASGATGSDGGTVFGGVDSRIISGPISIQNCKVLKVSHHGSGNSASFQLLNEVNPDVGVISAGLNLPENKYPEPTAIRRLLLRNMSVYVTDKLGSITVLSDGNEYKMETEYPRDEKYAIFINDVGQGGLLYWR
ncbi:MAG: MBL fold metallo-hydrolase [Candidatus Micrarchaeia archaeon]